ncbi:MAG: stage II sporulation protein P [Bacillota bacterium]
MVNYYIRYLLYRHRYKLAGFYRSMIIFSVGILSFCLAYYCFDVGALSKLTQRFSLFDISTSWSERDPLGLMRSAVPIMAWGGNNEDLPEEITPSSLITAMFAPFQVDFANPENILATEIPALAEYNRGRAVPVTMGPVNKEADLTGRSAGSITDHALIGVYHTHTGETYVPTDGAERVLPGQKGGIVEAGRAIKETLEKDYRIRVAHYDMVNDQIYSMSYAESEKTARRLLEDNKEVQIVLDIHRDAGKPRNESVVKVNGEEVAPILFIVGSDARSPFPSWRNNHSFAVRLSERINKQYPGLCIGVRIKEGRYNQFLHPRSILVEIGTVNNTTAEAVKSADLLARILAEELYEIAPDKFMEASTAGDADDSTEKTEVKDGT